MSRVIFLVGEPVIFKSFQSHALTHSVHGTKTGRVGNIVTLNDMAQFFVTISLSAVLFVIICQAPITKIVDLSKFKE